MTVRVATIEDDARYRASLELLLRLSPGIELAGSFGSPAAAFAALGESPTPPWDLVLMDLDLPEMSGIEATRRLKRLLPVTPVVVLTVFEDPPTILEAICAGADGYLTKDTPPAELLEQIRGVLEGGSPLTAGVAGTVIELLRRLGAGRAPDGDGSGPDFALTTREQEVLRCLMSGLAYKQVAARLDISLDTVRTHIRRIYGKLQVHSAAEAVTRAVREGLV